MFHFPLQHWSVSASLSNGQTSPCSVKILFIILTQKSQCCYYVAHWIIYENLQLEQQLFKESGYFSGFHPRPFTSTLYPGCMEMALSVNILFAYHRAVFIIFPFFLAFCIFCCYCCCWWWFLMVYKPRQDLIETEYGAENHPFHEKCHIVMAI